MIGSARLLILGDFSAFLFGGDDVANRNPMKRQIQVKFSK
jgi:hypothetical protein